jgi:hypothetical protein
LSPDKRDTDKQSRRAFKKQGSPFFQITNFERNARKQEEQRPDAQRKRDSGAAA